MGHHEEDSNPSKFLSRWRIGDESHVENIFVVKQIFGDGSKSGNITLPKS
jgi:hypothetical protein